MGNRYDHAAAARLAGELFGKILNRAADRDGYAYVLDSLESGKRSVRQHVVEMVVSEEYIDKYVANSNPHGVVRTLNKVLLGRQLSDPASVRREALRLVRMGLAQYAGEIVHSPDYIRAYGEDRVPQHGH